MCGIYGVGSIGLDEDNNKYIAEVKAGLSDLIHRGPDSQTIVASGEKSWIIGQDRLSIVGMDDKTIKNYISSIKFKNSGGDEYLLAFNGEIYNYKELRDDLELLGYDFATSSDSEVLLKSLVEYGSDIIERLDGQFAFFFRRCSENEIIMARDRMGKKPLYYSYENEKLRFSSEPEPLVRAIGFVPDIKSIASLFVNGVFLRLVMNHLVILYILE